MPRRVAIACPSMPPAFYADDHIAFFRIGKFFERSHDFIALELKRKIFFKCAPIDVDDSCPAAEADGRYGSFSAANANCLFQHDRPLNVCGLRILSFELCSSPA